VQDRLPQLRENRYVAMPAGVREELPAGIALDMLLIEVQQSLRHPATPFSSLRLDVCWDEALAVVRLSDEGFSDTAAWWLAREASVTAIVEELS
jgi:hypothetical protein